MPILAPFLAQLRRRVYDDLRAGREPSEGEFDAAVLREARARGEVQMGSVAYHPDHVDLEFIYPDRQGASTVFNVRVTAPERIVWMAVPDWVVESIWQGEISGSYRFESEANALVEQFAEGLRPEPNRVGFGRREPTRRE